jgi:excisionase family DNA binding protein
MQETQSNGGYLVTEDVAALLHCSVRSVQEHVARHSIPYRRVAGMRRTLFVREEIQGWLDGGELEVIEGARGGYVVRVKASALDAH